MLGEILLLKKYIKIADWSLPFTYGPLNITAGDARKIIKRLRWRKKRNYCGNVQLIQLVHLRLNLMDWWTSDGSNNCLVHVWSKCCRVDYTSSQNPPLCFRFPCPKRNQCNLCFWIAIWWDLSGQRWCWVELSWSDFRLVPFIALVISEISDATATPRKHRKRNT